MDDRIVLLDENGKEEEFEVAATFGLDDFNYAVLFPINDENEAYILRMEYDDNNELVLVGIEDDDELNDAILAYESILKENIEQK
ncbi:DUF1292 domain-containing protein [Anaerosalibacter bizertensis]|uniref:DUF1292 domain-containing protein n=1 Tax=Anaerosalibacter bizertensis TaxID=932217 RepID=UPI0017797BE7|nr:DUF1292 domain-containing protein [Anaerosalibacter bizertensis]MBU5292768.1 DUF1292 domain-containing protein [Anaerosalibacter bizertensis]HHV26089.1 DUF1292 domain-containing protein [Tissierellia bacterium]